MRNFGLALVLMVMACGSSVEEEKKVVWNCNCAVQCGDTTDVSTGKRCEVDDPSDETELICVESLLAVCPTVGCLCACVETTTSCE
jgi:hypothetical protein